MYNKNGINALHNKSFKPCVKSYVVTRVAQVGRPTDKAGGMSRNTLQ